MPPSIIEFLISLGGVRDEGGALRVLDLHRVNKGHFGRLAHRKGMALDRAREAAEEARYIRPDSTVFDLLEALRDCSFGGHGLTPEERGDSYMAPERPYDPFDDLPNDAASFRAWRATMGWTQKRAADELGTVLRTIGGYEIGQRKVSRTTGLACIALAISYNVRQI